MVSVVDYGAFVHIRDGIEGMIAQSDIVAPPGENGEEAVLFASARKWRPRWPTSTRRSGASLSRCAPAAATAPAATTTASGGGESKAPRATKASKKAAASAVLAAGGTIGELIKQKLGAKLATIGDKKDETDDE